VLLIRIALWHLLSVAKGAASVPGFLSLPLVATKKPVCAHASGDARKAAKRGSRLQNMRGLLVIRGRNGKLLRTADVQSPEFVRAAPVRPLGVAKEKLDSIKCGMESPPLSERK
jgi:hypothetical protein